MCVRVTKTAIIKYFSILTHLNLQFTETKWENIYKSKNILKFKKFIKSCFTHKFSFNFSIDLIRKFYLF